MIAPATVQVARSPSARKCAAKPKKAPVSEAPERIPTQREKDLTAWFDRHPWPRQEIITRLVLDVFGHARPVGEHYLIERGPSYLAIMFGVDRRQARSEHLPLLEGLFGLLRAVRLDPTTTTGRSAITASGISLPVGRWAGTFWRITTAAHHELVSLREHARTLGHAVPGYDLGWPVRLRLGDRQGRRQMAHCPIHGTDSTPSMVLDPGGNAYCFACVGSVGRWVDAGQHVVFRPFRGGVGTGRPTHAVSLLNPLKNMSPKTGVDSDASRAVSENADISALEADSVSQVEQAPAWDLDRIQRAGQPLDLGPRKNRHGFPIPAQELFPALATVQATVQDAEGRTVRSSWLRPCGLVLRTGHGARWREGYAEHFDLLDQLAQDDRRSATTRAANPARKVADQLGRPLNDYARSRLRGGVPERYLSLDWRAAQGFRRGEPTPCKGGLTVIRDYPKDFTRSHGSRWVAWDLDGFTSVPMVVGGPDEVDLTGGLVTRQGQRTPFVAQAAPGDLALAAAGHEIEQHLRSGDPAMVFTGRIGIVRTSLYCAQIVAELHHFRAAPADLWACGDFVALVQAVGVEIMAALARHGWTGGRIDHAFRQPNVRRPGWRLRAREKGGPEELIRVRLAYATPDDEHRERVYFLPDRK